MKRVNSSFVLEEWISMIHEKRPCLEHGYLLCQPLKRITGGIETAKKKTTETEINGKEPEAKLISH